MQERGEHAAQSRAEFYASSTDEVYQKSSSFYAIWGKDLQRQWNTGLVTGAADKIPYPGAWYPQANGGTNVVNDPTAGKSSLQKYDTAFNAGKTLATEWEQNNHTIATNHANAGWAGHCNGFSAASQRHSEPQKSVIRNGVTFTPKDIKALLAEAHMNVKFLFLGGNRCEIDEATALPTPAKRADQLRLDVCDDMNPGTFHIALTNWIGLMHHPVIMDMSAKEQVWNFPVYQYAFNYSEITKAQAIELVTGANSDTYTFNPDAQKFIQVAIRIYYAAASSAEVISADLQQTARRNTAVFKYVLELNTRDEIIGGEWIAESQQSHPDFMWVALEPASSDGTPFSSNPYVAPDEVIKLWAESVGQDPSKPQLDILEPTYVSSWGKSAKYDLAIDGQNGGVVFANRPFVLTLDRKDALSGDFLVRISVDEKKVFDQAVSGGGVTNLTIPKLTRGLHLLQIDWLKGDNVADRQKIWVRTF